MIMTQTKRHFTGLVAGLVFGSAVTALAAEPPVNSAAAHREAERLDSMQPVAPPRGRGAIDRSGRSQKGRASFYARSFTNHKMANGRRMDPNAHVAASKTLPLGSVAKVVNTENGKEVTVRVEDRGPFVSGRVVDLSPRVARELDISKQGVAEVVVKPITVPLPDGGVKLGSGAADASQQEVDRAAGATREMIGMAQPNDDSR
jgi:rare lipoprotein A